MSKSGIFFTERYVGSDTVFKRSPVGLLARVLELGAACPWYRWWYSGCGTRGMVVAGDVRVVAPPRGTGPGPLHTALLATFSYF